MNWVDPEGLNAGAITWGAGLVGTILIVIPEPSTTAAGTVMLLAAVATIPGDTPVDRALTSPQINSKNWMMNESDEGGEECEVPTSPPDGLVENPHRPGSWGEIGPDGKFEEKWRRDKGRPEIKRGHGSQDHIHVNGRWYPIKKK